MAAIFRARVAAALVALVVVAGVAALPGQAFAAAPGNDSAAAPSTLVGSSGSVEGDNTEATPEAADPDLYPQNSDDGGHSLWYSWTASAGGVVTFDTASSAVGRDTILVAYAGTEAIAWNDDIDYVGGNLRSRMGVNVVEGTTYTIFVDAWRVADAPAEQLGTFILSWAPGGAVSPPPPGDPTGPQPVNFRIGGVAAKHAGTLIAFRIDAHANIDFGNDEVEVALTPSIGLKVVSVSGPAGAHCAAGADARRCWFAGAAADTASSLTLTAIPLSEAPQSVAAVLTATGDADETDDAATVTATTAEICDVLGTDGADTLTGTAGADVVCGLGGNDTLRGQSGDDLLFGGTGIDAVSYAGAPAVSLDLAKQGAGLIGAWPRSGSGGHGRDSLIGIENVIGTSYADLLRGNAGPNSLRGGSGNDALYGLGGADVLLGEAGNDLLAGGTQDDNLSGGTGIDAVSYAGAPAVSLDLAKQGAGLIGAWPRSGSGGHGRDSLIGIENVIGTSYADVLRGNAGPNSLRGGSGNDALYGLGGADVLLGEAGNDLLAGGTQTDDLNGGTGTDTCRETTDRKIGCERV